MRHSSSILAVQQYGDLLAPKMVLLHGFGASSLWWSRLVDELAKHASLSVLDLCFQHPIEAMAREVLTWMQQENMQGVVMVGHSLGTAIALSLLAQDPERIARLILLNPVVSQPHVRVWTWIIRCRHARKISRDPPAKSSLSLRWRRENPRSWRWVLQALRQTKQEGQVTIATLILWGQYDPLFPVAYAPQFLQSFTDAQLVVVNGGHSVMYERSEEVSLHIQQFFKAGKDLVE